ncbi:MAG: hypothetical protein QF464_16820, partial [Myxococcota bacterium]|nr:hypothetical protein [Myxococcota bacterium]
MGIASGGPTAHAASFGFGGHVHQRFERLTDFGLDEDGTSHGQPMRHIMRARFGAAMSFSRQFWVRSQIQLLDGQILGTESPIPSGAQGEAWHNAPVTHHLQLRESTIQIPIGLGVVRVGRMPIRWGMGLVVHDGQSVD